MRYWLCKSEPDEFSIDDLAKKGSSFWDGIRNYQVRNMIRDSMKIGDKALFYHSNAGLDTGVVGEMEVVSEALPDPTQFDSKSHYYDAKSLPENPRWLGAEMKFTSRFSKVVRLAELKGESLLKASPLIKKGNRLSIIPLTAVQYKRLVHLGNK